MFENVCYLNNNISEMVCRFDFATPIDILRRSMPKVIFDKVKSYFPVVEPQDVIGAELTIDKNNPLAVPEINQVKDKQWVFLSRDRKNKCIIEFKGIIFSVCNYSTFEDIKDALLQIISVVLNEFQDSQGKRLGLRYINDIDIKNNENEWVKQEYYRALSAHKDESTTKLTTEVDYAVNDGDITVRLLYGFRNPDYPSTIKRNEFVIDVDAFLTGIIYKEDIEQLIDTMHEEDQKYFEKMITDSYREYLNTAN